MATPSYQIVYRSGHRGARWRWADLLECIREIRELEGRHGLAEIARIERFGARPSSSSSLN
jgi:hypothetical protein